MMTAKEFLLQVSEADQEIDRKLMRLGGLYAEATRTTSLYREKTGGNSPGRTMEDRMLPYLQLRDEINADIDNLVELKRGICAAIDALPKEKYRSVLEMHYLQGMTFNEIGDELDYSERQVRRLENLALRLLCVPDP